MVNRLVGPLGYLGPCFLLGQKGFLCWVIGTLHSDIGLASRAKVSLILRPRSYKSSCETRPCIFLPLITLTLRPARVLQHHPISVWIFERLPLLVPIRVKCLDSSMTTMTQGINGPMGVTEN